MFGSRTPLAARAYLRPGAESPRLLPFTRRPFLKIAHAAGLDPQVVAGPRKPRRPVRRLVRQLLRPADRRGGRTRSLAQRLRRLRPSRPGQHAASKAAGERRRRTDPRGWPSGTCRVLADLARDGVADRLRGAGLGPHVSATITSTSSTTWTPAWSRHRTVEFTAFLREMLRQGKLRSDSAAGAACCSGIAGAVSPEGGQYADRRRPRPVALDSGHPRSRRSTKAAPAWRGRAA